MKTFNQYIKESEIVDLSKKREEKKIGEFANDLRDRVKQRVAAQNEIVKKYKDDGKFEFEVGDRFHTPFTKERDEPPYKVIGHYVNTDRRTGEYKSHGYYVERKYGPGEEDFERHQISAEKKWQKTFEKVHPLKIVKKQ